MALVYNFVTLYAGSGKLALSERPKLREIEKLVPTGCRLVVTILSGKGEKAHMIGKHLSEHGIRWEWLRVANANALTVEEAKQFQSSLQCAINALAERENVLVHCSGGRHRTGIFAYALLRKLNRTPGEALDLIREIRQETFNSLEEKYLELAEALV